MKRIFQMKNKPGGTANSQSVMTSETTEVPLLSIQNVQKQFGYRQVLKGVSLHLLAGQSILLVGRNGAGKSTLIRILSGLMRPTAGNVLFQGNSLAEDSAKYRQSFGLMTDETFFYGDLTATENLTFFGRLRKLKRLNQRIDDALDRTGLSSAADLPVKAFSSGMGKRLNIARIMMSDPDILFLDEPYSGLDQDSIAMLNRYLESVKQKRGGILLISHQIDACSSVVDSAVILEDGVILKQVPGRDLDPSLAACPSLNG